jgi:hypothetical protein
MESSGVMCVSTSTASRKRVLGVALAGKGMWCGDEMLPPFFEVVEDSEKEAILSGSAIS